MAKTPLETVRKICLELPEAHEVEAWGAPTFRVKNKLFVMYASPDNHHGWGRPGIWVKSTAVNQDLLIQSDKDRFFFPPYVGPSGWVGICLDKGADWGAIASLVRDGYALTAPKKILALLESIGDKPAGTGPRKSPATKKAKRAVKAAPKSKQPTRKKKIAARSRKTAKKATRKRSS
jgi:predicted DNA-binding protein (MmcQ/YjbR family)